MPETMSQPTSSPTSSTTTAATTSPPPNPQATLEARAAFLGSLSSVGTSLTNPLESRAQTIHSNASALTAQEADLKKSTKALAKSGDEFQKLADENIGKLKEIGDVQNWAECIERDLQVLEESLRLAEEEGVEPKDEGERRRRWW